MSPGGMSLQRAIAQLLVIDICASDIETRARFTLHRLLVVNIWRVLARAGGTACGTR